VLFRSQAAESLNTTDDLPGVLKLTVENACRLFGTKMAMLRLYDPYGKRFLPERSVARGLPPELADLPRSLSAEPTPHTQMVMDRGWVVVPDLTAKTAEPLDRPFVELLAKLKARAFQAVALKAGHEPLGILYSIHAQPLHFSQELRSRAGDFAGDVASALKKALLLERVRRTKAAAEVVAEVTAAGYPDATSRQMIADQTREALGCSSIVLFESDADGLPIHPPTTSGVNRDVIEHPDEQKDYVLVERVLARDEPLIVPRVLEDDDFKHRRFVRLEGVRSCAAIPLKTADRTVGAMFVNYRRDHDFPREEEIGRASCRERV